jgi:predicted nucleic acid-binding protein
LAIAQLGRLLRQHSRIALDTSIFMYQLQAHPKYVAFTEAVFTWLEKPKAQGVTSTITMTELLVQPYRSRDQQRADEIYGLLSTFPNLSWVSPSLEIADSAAQVRAKYALRTPDALQAATALRSLATALITNDSSFRSVAGIQVVILDDMI